MKKFIAVLIPSILSLLWIGSSRAALIVPNEIQQPGTQEEEITNLENLDRCSMCHSGYNPDVEPYFNWSGSMMANAARDPLFWAALAIAEQDFDGSGDLCIRCHSPRGWYSNRSTPTDGSGLAASDVHGVECEICHKMTNPNQLEFLGVMNDPFIANDQQTPPKGFYGSGMLVLSSGDAKLGPYTDAFSPQHTSAQSAFHRDIAFCGSCHDVSNPAVGDLAHNHGAQTTSDPVIASGVLGGALETKAAFNNFPYQYGVIERTFSEYSASGLSKTLVEDYLSLPYVLRAGSVENAYLHAQGNYADGTPRYFSCQTCHVPAVTGKGSNRPSSPTRTDLPLHDMTGGSYWVQDAIQYQDTQGTLRFGGGLTASQIDALNASQARAIEQLQMSASLVYHSSTLKITNLTGHKLITGYPEGRRMWVNIQWFDANQTLLREDGAYGPITVTLGGITQTVNTLLDLHDPNTRIYETHYGMTQEWANQLIGLGYPQNLALTYDRITSEVDLTLGELAALEPGESRETFHFVLNNVVISDNRIPPYGFDPEEARKRNVLPVPAGLYQDPDGSYRFWDNLHIVPPANAATAEFRLLYQSTSWEHIQFLYLANRGENPFLGNEGANLLDAWKNTGMCEPVIMAELSVKIFQASSKIFLPLVILPYSLR